MYIETCAQTADSASEAISTLIADWSAAGREMSFAALHHQAGIVPDEVWQKLSNTGCAVHGASSCLGVMSGEGTAQIGVFALSDPDGDYGTACLPISSDTYSTARRATEEALETAGRVGEAPDLVWISITPGAEEDAVRAISDLVGANVPVIGGSAADDTVEGRWTVTDGVRSYGSGLVVTVMFCSAPPHIAYQNGYEPTSHTGTVTRAQGRRVFEIDGRAAAEVYQEWTGGSVPVSQGTDDLNILSEATLWPWGREFGKVGNVPYFLLAHPCGANADGSIDLFAEVAQGEALTQMNGDACVLAARAGRVAEFTQRSAELSASDVAGALMVYCGGCMLAVQDRLSEVYSGVDTALQHAPFLGVFTFGEQGRIHDVGNRHGNLMISCIAFVRGE